MFEICYSLGARSSCAGWTRASAGRAARARTRCRGSGRRRWRRSARGSTCSVDEDVSISIPINCPPDYCHFAGLNASDVPILACFLLFASCLRQTSAALPPFPDPHPASSLGSCGRLAGCEGSRVWFHYQGCKKAWPVVKITGNVELSSETYLIIDLIQLLIYWRETTEVIRWLLPAASFLGCYSFFFCVSLLGLFPSPVIQLDAVTRKDSSGGIGKENCMPRTNSKRNHNAGCGTRQLRSLFALLLLLLLEHHPRVPGTWSASKSKNVRAQDLIVI